MDKVYNFKSVSEYNAFNNHDTMHPLVSVLDFSKAKKRTGSTELADVLKKPCTTGSPYRKLT